MRRRETAPRGSASRVSCPAPDTATRRRALLAEWTHSQPDDSSNSGTASSTDIVIRARGVTGGEHINLLIGGIVEADWNLSTNDTDYTYTGDAAGDIQVEFDNDGGDRDVILDYVYVNGETRQAEDMEFNTATYYGMCGEGSFSETMHCNGVIGFGETGDCFSGNCSGGNTDMDSP